MVRKMHAQRGFSLVELAIVLTIGAIITAIALQSKTKEAVIGNAASSAHYAVMYAKAVADYTSINQSAISDGDTYTGTEWLKHVDCGAGVGLDPEHHYLPCDFDATLRLGFGLSEPTVTYTVAPGALPQGTIDFGQVDGSWSGVPAAVIAAEIINKANEQVTDNLSTYLSFNLPDDTMDGSVIATVDRGTPYPFMRLDAPDPIVGTLVSRQDGWALFTQDSTEANFVGEAQNRASINVNDVYVRSSNSEAGAWVSDTHKIAENAYEKAEIAERLAKEAVRFETMASSGDPVLKPACDAGYIPQIFVSTGSFISPTNDELVGIDAYAIDNGASWTVVIEALSANNNGWQNLLPSQGKIKVSTKCTRV